LNGNIKRKSSESVQELLSVFIGLLYEQIDFQTNQRK